MKKLINYLMMGAVAATLMTTSSCTKTCDSGYEGSDCKTESRAKFIGQWKGQDVCTTGTYNNITITTTNASSNVLDINIANMGGFGASVVVSGTVNSANSNQVDITSEDLGGGRTLTGTLTLSGTTIATSYTVTPTTGSVDVCSGSYTKL
jgi:hypothetical protein